MKTPILGIVSTLIATVSAFAQPSLKDAFHDHFLIGVALNDTQFEERNAPEAALIKSQFNSVTAENAMKWSSLHPEPDGYRFESADRFVEFGERNNMFIVGHTLVWHSQVPEWLFKDDAGNPVDRKTLLARMRQHIQTVVGHYKGRVKGWDVVNEALGDDGSLRDSPWLQIIGEDYIQKAFEFAHQADPAAELYYNDYGIEGGKKRDGAIDLITKLRSAGVPVAGIGIQGHMSVDSPQLEVLDESITAFGRLGIKVMITELDVDVLPSPWAALSADVNLRAESRSELNPYPAGLPKEITQNQTRRYAELFALFLKHRGVLTRVTFWGLTDRATWLNDFPIPGRTNHPLLFDREGRPKPAYEAVLEAARRAPKSDN